MSSGEELSTADKLSLTAVQLPTGPTSEDISSNAERMSFRVTGMLTSGDEKSSVAVPSNPKISILSTASRYLFPSSWTQLAPTVDQQNTVTSFPDNVTVASIEAGIPDSHNSTNLTFSVHGVVVGGSGSPAAVTGVTLSPMAVQFVIVGALFGTVLLLGLANVLLYLRRTGQMRRTIYSVFHLSFKHHNHQRQNRYNCRRAAVTRRGQGNGRNAHRTTVRMKPNHSPFVC